MEDENVRFDTDPDVSVRGDYTPQPMTRFERVFAFGALGTLMFAFMLAIIFLTR